MYFCGNDCVVKLATLYKPANFCLLFFVGGVSKHNIKKFLFNKVSMDLRAQSLADGYVDGLGNRFYTEPSEMTLESEIAPVEACFSYSDYMKATKSSDMDIDEHLFVEDGEMSIEDDEMVEKESTETKRGRGSYRFYNNSVKQRFWQLVMEEGVSAYKAALLEDIPLQTAYTWKRNWNRMVVNLLNGISEPPKKRGRKPLLTDEHKEFLQNLIKEDATVTLEVMLESLKKAFKDVRAKATTIYTFVTKVCKFSLKRIAKWASRRSLEELKQQRLEWAEEYKDKLDFNKNCIFIDEAGFNISMRREYGWSAVGEKAILTVPVTRGLNVSFIGAISAKGCIELKLRTPVTSPNKKRKLDSDGSSPEASRGTTANHFYSFVKSIIHQIESNDDLKDMKYLILDNAAIHKRRDLQLLVALSGLELVFLPPYSPALNAIEEFWAVCKSKVKRSNLSKKEQLTPKVREATQHIALESYEGFCRHASSHFELCLQQELF